MMTHWQKNHRTMGVYHPVKSKAEQFIQQYQNGYVLTEKELAEQNVIILALPASEVIPFIDQLLAKNSSPPNTCFVNMATSLLTKEIKNKFPDLPILGVKYMGHSKDLLERGNGLFITESPLPVSIEDFFKDLGEVKVDSEELLIQVNKLATYYAIKAALEIESQFAKKGFDDEYVQRALTSLAPEVIRSYSEGSLGHFGKEVVQELQREVVETDEHTWKSRRTDE
ncbi:hypothetical protein F9802_13875 [Bacillus aerolatus]|uniref:6-phosphogluconate dehydrogenase NADP-binding domain-containing protein n=2 Tax=Bacillus aerolatus TaxID=2653354 RepID=A0A6I1FDK2_9BACI|nr:hypothetical protein F9802_13875 [Bacillus aerolatus]